MSSLSQFAGGVPVGSIVEAPYNFGVNNTDYLLCDHSTVVKATYPLLAAQYPAAFGTFTPTTRTPGTTPSSNAGASNGTIWAIAGVAGTSAIQTTPDGVTWTARTTPALTDVRSILWLGGTRWAASVLGSAQPLYSSDNAVTWTAATGSVQAPAGATQCCAAYTSTIGASGRIVMTEGSDTVYTSDDFGVTYTARATALGVNVFNICWTGTRFVATISNTASIAVSTDGITWTSVLLPILITAATATTSFIASDGAGRVVITKNAQVATNFGILVSQDSGATWSQRMIPNYAGDGQSTALQSAHYPSFTNGLFFLANTLGGGAVSTDLKSFVTISNNQLFRNLESVVSNAGIYLSTGGSATLKTIVNDSSTMYLPGQITNTSTSFYSLNSQPQWIKAK